MLGIAIVAAGWTLRFALFDIPWLNWVGMMTHKPATEDYVPLFPWLGVVLIGIFGGAWVAGRDRTVIASLRRFAPAGSRSSAATACSSTWSTSRCFSASSASWSDYSGISYNPKRREQACMRPQRGARQYIRSTASTERGCNEAAGLRSSFEGA